MKTLTLGLRVAIVAQQDSVTFDQLIEAGVAKRSSKLKKWNKGLSEETKKILDLMTSLVCDLNDLVY